MLRFLDALANAIEEQTGTRVSRLEAPGHGVGLDRASGPGRLGRVDPLCPGDLANRTGDD
jgi:hypothetical protein